MALQAPAALLLSLFPLFPFLGEALAPPGSAWLLLAPSPGSYSVSCLFMVHVGFLVPLCLSLVLLLWSLFIPFWLPVQVHTTNFSRHIWLWIQSGQGAFRQDGVLWKVSIMKSHHSSHRAYWDHANLTHRSSDKQRGAIISLICQTPFLTGKCHNMLGLHNLLLFVVLSIKLRVSHMLSKWSTTNLYPEALNASCLALSWSSWVLYFPCWISLSILHLFSWPSNNWGNYVGIFLCWWICQFPLPY